MQREEFLTKIITAVEIEEVINENSILEEIEEWGSLALVTVLALFKTNLGINVKASDMRNCKTIKDLLDLGNEKYE